MRETKETTPTAHAARIAEAVARRLVRGEAVTEPGGGHDTLVTVARTQTAAVEGFLATEWAGVFEPAVRLWFVPLERSGSGRVVELGEVRFVCAYDPEGPATPLLHPSVLPGSVAREHLSRARRGKPWRS